MIKLIAVDMDGTALNSRKEITEATRKAVRHAQAAGARVVVATGRIAGEAAIFAREMGADAEMIVAGGAALADAQTGKNVLSYSLAPDLCADILTVVQQHPTHAMLYAEEKLLSRPGLMDEWVKGGGRAEGAASRHIYVDDPAAAVRAERLSINKIFISAVPAVLEALAARLSVFSGIHVTRSGADNIEIMPEGVDKGVALCALAARLGLDIQETLAIGDSDNDRAMLFAAGTAVLMANGAPSLRPLADYIAPDNDHDGVADAIYRYLPPASPSL